MNDDLNAEAGHAGTPHERVEPQLEAPASQASQASQASSATPSPASTPATAATPAPAPIVLRRRRPFWQWWLIVSFAVSLVALACLVLAIGHIDDTPMHVIVDGEEVGNGINISLGSLTPAHQVALVAAAVLAVVIALLVVPIALAIALVVTLLAVAIAVVAGIGVPLVAVTAALMLATSPIWVPVMLVVWVIRANRRAAAATAAAMAAAGGSSATIRA